DGENREDAKSADCGTRRRPEAPGARRGSGGLAERAIDVFFQLHQAADLRFENASGSNQTAGTFRSRQRRIQQLPIGPEGEPYWFITALSGFGGKAGSV